MATVALHPACVLIKDKGVGGEVVCSRRGGCRECCCMQLDWPNVQHNAVYWQGVLYVNCQTKFIMRISLSNANYQVIKPPVATEGMKCSDLYLEQSEKGVYCALYGHPYLFWIYILDELSGKMEWVFKRCVIFG